MNTNDGHLTELTNGPESLAEGALRLPFDMERMKLALSGPSFRMPPGLTHEQRRAFFALAVEATAIERERCLRLTEEARGGGGGRGWNQACDWFANAIRKG
jgi:hypothetical protein